MVWDAIVIGAGPSGSSCAYFLASKGARVLLLEKQPFPPDKPCAGGLDGLAYRLFPKEVEECSSSKVWGLCFLSNGKYYLHSFPYPLFHLTNRRKFIERLILKAVEAGAQFYDKSPAEIIDEGIVRSGDRVERGRFIVDASGVGSKIAPLLGARYSLYRTISADIPTSGRTKYEGVAFFEIYPDGRGYSWIFLKGECLSVGSGGLGKVEKRFYSFLEFEGLRAEGKRGWLLPVRLPQSPLSKNNIILVGDAAGLVDPLTGAGISWGMLSGKLAAQAIMEGDAGKYEGLVRMKILPDFKVASMLFKLLPLMIRLRIIPQRSLPIKFIGGVVAGKFRYRDVFRVMPRLLFPTKRI